jgi:hypothetical protein
MTTVLVTRGVVAIRSYWSSPDASVQASDVSRTDLINIQPEKKKKFLFSDMGVIKNNCI